jgi:glutamate dehydrogenase (NADP+)
LTPASKLSSAIQIRTAGTQYQLHRNLAILAVPLEPPTSENAFEGDDLDFLNDLRRKYPHQPTFLQAVEEMAVSIRDVFDGPDGDFYQRAFLAMAEPERIIAFRVSWTDDEGKIRFNRGWRVQFSRYVAVRFSRSGMLPNILLMCVNVAHPYKHSVLGPFKGGLRFHPTVDEGVLKFLGFEQIFKNALTGLPLGGGKGGSDFDPKGKSDGEVRRFCENFMSELCRYLHPSADVPAGDIGVGGREIGYMYGQYKRLINRHGVGVLTGKSMNFGGSEIRPEATGYGLVYMAKIAVQRKLNRNLTDMRCAISGSGNVAQFAAKKLLEFGATVMTVSDSNGVIVFENGMTATDWDAVSDCKNKHRGRLASIQDKVSGQYYDGESPWSLDIKYDLALPCATQNEIDEKSARQLVKNGVLGVLEGANLPTDLEAQAVFRKADGVIYVPGKASNAGGVGVSGLEMSQNAQRLTWKSEKVDEKLHGMMDEIYSMMEEAELSGGTLEQGANRAGFLKVATAMRELGWVY